MQVMSFIKASPGSTEELKQWLLDTYTTHLLENASAVHGLRINLSTEPPKGFSLYGGVEQPFGPIYDAVIQVWCDSEADFQKLQIPLSGQIQGKAQIIHHYKVQEDEVLNRPELLQGTPRPGFKLIRGIQFHDDMPDRVIQRCWRHHQNLAVKVHIGLARYVCDWVEKPLSPNAPNIQGVTELHFPSEEAMIDRYFDSPRGAEEILHDIGHFISAGGHRLFTKEYVFK